MSDDNITPRQFGASCPLCAARLSVEHDGTDLKGNERVLCPVHGDMGSLEEVHRSIFFKEHRNYVIGGVNKIVRTIKALERYPNALNRRDSLARLACADIQNRHLRA
jgi:hypothetical protein